MVVRYVLFVGVRIGWNFLAIFFSDAIIVYDFCLFDTRGSSTQKERGKASGYYIFHYPITAGTLSTHISQAHRNHKSYNYNSQSHTHNLNELSFSSILVVLPNCSSMKQRAYAYLFMITQIPGYCGRSRIFPSQCF
jgi:hypothetical protein